MEIKADRTNLNTLLGIPNQILKIPPYQRPYAWTSEQVDDLWNDLIQTLDAGHFLGSIVLNCEIEMCPEVIDGQQRLTTLSLLLSLIRDEYSRVRPELSGSVHQFIEDSYATGDDRFKFRSGKANWQVLCNFILRSPTDPARKKWSDFASLSKEEQARNLQLKNNFERLTTHIKDRKATRSDSEWLADLERLSRAIIKGLEFVVIKVKNVADAFVIFETLNDRGLALSAGDLLKNHLLANAAHARDSVEDLANEWEAFLASLNSADVTRFLRHYLLIRHSGVMKDDVFGYFKKEVKELGARALMTELRTSGGIYGHFVDPSGIENTEVKEALDDLVTLRAVMCYTALLPARRYLSDDDFVAYARLAETLTFRFSTICGKDSKDLERCYHASAKTLNETKGKGLATARSILVKAMPTSEEFQTAFLQQSMGQKYLVNYVFRKIEETLDTEEKTTRQSGPVHIEHILPQTSTPAWVDALGSRATEYDDFVNRWGNLTLLGGGKNIRASNDSLAAKKIIYQGSNIQMTKQLASLEKWDIGTIEQRQRELAKMADRLWFASE